ncbi:hypothetical protein LSTR_LSTR002619 [Laodelphax striatellus]|uniref:Protein ELYS n=1 Tax=Laodelphax striatellus TaxID=195883 RepID=A0A482XLF3_LAOST|nr:hypothetical protein LSTR_LSTR002619 [Laodelphax striatellus]
MNQEGSVLNVTSSLKISSRIDDKYLQDDHSLDEHFEVNGKILNESNFLCINCGPQVSVLRKKNGSKYSFWSADRTTRDTVTKITCIVEVNLGTGVPLLAAGTEEGLLCFYYTGVSRILRAVQFNHKIVSLALLDNGDRSEVGNWITLPEELQMMNGVLAVGLDGGAVFLVDICRHLLEKSIREGGPVTIEIPSQLLLIDLRSDTANDIHAKTEYAHSHPGETLAIFLNESTLDQFRRMITSSISTPVLRRSIDDSVEEFHLVVTALAYFKEIACLVVGFNSGCFQLWHMSLFRIIYVSPMMDGQMMPIAGFSFQEPTDDPHSVCFMWAAHQSSSTNAMRPLAAMYMISFSNKKHIDGYGCFYENYKGCQPKYELSLGEDVDSVIDGRIISCHSISRVIQRRLPQWSIQSSSEDENIVSVCAIAWEVWTPDRTNVTSKLTLFDINQWYRAQMPFNLESGGSSSYVTNILLPNSNEEQPEPLLDVWISAESLSQFSAYQPLDEHYFPLSLSFACTCLYEHKKLECVWKGVQNELLSSLESAGPSALLDPSRYFNRFLAVGLKPSFYEASDSANLSVVTERQMLLTVMLEQGHSSFVKECVRMWADGCLAVANCTLPTLLRWGWSAVTFYKQMADNICIQLFDLHSTLSVTMKEFVYVVSLLHKLSEIFDYILKNYRNFILEDNVELQSISLQLYIEYLDSVVWSTQHKLLPEVSDPSVSLNDVIPYPQVTLQNNVIERREKMRQLSRKLLEVNPQLCVADLLLVDTLLKATPGGKRVISQWEAEGSLVGGLYPPPSVQSILRIFLVRGVAAHFKHMLIYYFLLDVADLLQQDHPSATKMLQNFVTKFRLTKSQVLITKAFWLIDHGKLKEAVDHLTQDNVCQNDITESNHKTVMYSLLVKGEPKLALMYSRAFNPLLSELEDAKFHILILLECGHILQAFDFQRKYRQWQTELLDLFFTVCMRRKELGVVYKLSLDSSEEEAFTQFLEANRHPHSEDLRVLYLLSRARYVEAIDVNKKLAVKRTQGAPSTPMFERRTPLKGLAFKKNTQKPKDDESRDQIRDVIVSAFAKTLPPVTRELADFCSRQKVTLGSWKKVDRPDPLSVSVNQQPLQAGLKERFVELALAKTRQTWAPLLATPHALKSRLRSTVEDTPFLRSTPFNFKSKTNSPRLTEHNQSLMSASKFSAKRVLVSDEVDEASLLKSETRTKRARLEFDDVLDKKKEKDDGALLLSTPFIKRKRAVVASEVTPRTPLSILKSPWKSGQSSLSRHSDVPSSPMPRQIRFCEELETESSIDRRSTPSRASIRFDTKASTSAAVAVQECIQELSETDEDIDMTSPSPLTQSDSENCDTEQSFIKVTFSHDKENSHTQLDSDSAKTFDEAKPVAVHNLEIDNEQPQSSTPPEEDSSVIDIPSSDSRIEIPSSSPDPIATETLDEDNDRYNNGYEEQAEEQKTYQDLSSASVFVNVTGELESPVFEELEDGEIGTAESDPIELGEDAVISKEVVYNDDVVQEKEEPEEIDVEDENKIDIYAGIDDGEDVEKDDNFEGGDEEFYKEDEYMENYRQNEVIEKNEFSSVDEHNREEVESEKEGEENERPIQDEEEEDDDDQVICLDGSSNSDQSLREEPVTVIPKKSSYSSEEELDYDESRVYGDEEEEEEGEEGEVNNYDYERDEEDDDDEEESIEEEERLSDDEEGMMEEGEEEEEEEEEDDEEYARKLSEEENSEHNSNDSLSNKQTNISKKLETSKRFINPFCKKREESSTSVQDACEIEVEPSNEEEEIQDNVEVDNYDCQENQECIESDVQLFEDQKCETEEVDSDNFELKIVDVTGNTSAFQADQSAEHNESFGKLEISYEEEPGSGSHLVGEQVDVTTTVDENISEVVGSKLDTIKEESVENRTEASTQLTSETNDIPKTDEQSEATVKNVELEVNSDEHVSEKTQTKDISDEHVRAQVKDVPDDHEGAVDDTSLSTPLRTRRNRRSSSEIPPSRDLKHRRSVRKSLSSNRLNDLPSTTVEEDNVSKDFFDISPTVPLNIQNARSRRTSSVVHTPSKVTRQSLRKSTSSSVLPEVAKTEETTVVSSSQAMEETLKTSRLISLKDSDCSTIIEDKSEETLKNSGEKPIVESMVIEESGTFDITNKTNYVQQTIEQEKTDISDNKTTTDEVEVDETLKKKTESVSETIVEESGGVVEETLVNEKRSSIEENTSKVEETAATDELTAATTVSDSYSRVKDIKRPSSRGAASEAPESIYTEIEDPIVQKPTPRRAASVSKLDDETGKLERIRRSSRRYRSGMVWSEYSKKVDSYKKLQLNNLCAATSVSSALDTADDVSLASVRESISSATTATRATASSRKLRHSRFKDRSSLRTAFRSFDVLLSDDEDDTTKSAVARTSSVSSVVGSITTVAEEISPIKSFENNDEKQKEIEKHSESIITNHEEEKDVDEDVVNETKNDGKIESVIPKKTRKTKTETKRKVSTQSKNDSEEDLSLIDLQNKVRSDKKDSRKSVADKSEAEKPIKRSRSISSLSTTSKRTQLSHNDESEEEASGRARLRSSRVSRSESPVGVRRLAKRSTTVDGDLFGNDSPDTTLTRSLQKTMRRDLRRSKLLDRPPSRNMLDVILSENEEEEDEEDAKVDEEVKKPVKKRGKKVVADDDRESDTPAKGKRGKAKTAVVSDVESTPATPKRTRRTKQLAEDSDVSMSAASSSKQPKRGRRSSVVLDNSPAKSRLFSSPESVASNASTTKKRKRLSHLMPVSSTPETNAQADVSVLDSSVIDYSSSRRLTRHQLANMQKFPMHADNSSAIDFSSSRRSTRDQQKFPARHDESSMFGDPLAESEDEGSVAESSVSSVMSTRSSQRLRMKSMKKH